MNLLGEPSIAAIKLANEVSITLCGICGQVGMMRGLTCFKTLCDRHAEPWMVARPVAVD